MATRAGGSVNLISFLIFAFLCIWGLDSSLVAGANTIGIGDELNSSSNPLVSRGGSFTLKFFTLSFTNYSYFGIWCTNRYQDRPVWVANPNTPLLNNSGVLTIDGKGVLKITSGGSTFLNISDQVPTGNVTATLHDSGNFVLMDQTEGRTLWESFDHPSSTLLPGMKLGQNLRTGHNWSLTSWLSNYVAASGAFTLSWEPTQESGQLVIYRRGEVYWKSGVLRNQSFEFMPVLNSVFSLYSYNLSYIYNNDERSFTFSSHIDPTQNLPTWFLKPEGRINAGDNIFISPGDFCYGYQSDTGCANSAVPEPHCRGHNDRFKQTARYFTNNSGSNDYNSSLSFSDCMQRCWNDCNCVAFIDSSNGTGCTIWSGNLEPRDDNPDAPIIYSLDSGNSSNTGNSSKENRRWIWFIIAVAISLLVLFLGLFCYLRIKKHRTEGEEEKRLHELTASDSFNNANEIENEGREGHDLKIFSFASIVAATNGFSNEKKLGQGGFGPVYKGILSEGREIAIKRLLKTSRQGFVEFKNELVLIAKLQHTNLVRLLGCCIHGEEKMLIYEYMPNKSLDFFLFGNKWWTWLIIALAIFLLVLFLGLFYYLRIRNRRREGEEKKLLHELTTSDSFNNANEIANVGRRGHNLRIFSFASIVAATNDFSSENKLGEGGFGPVYKGNLSDGQEIAIKRLSETSGQGLVEFKNELILITKLQHMNLVRVLGCCIHKEEKMLIYEYMPNKGLDFFLFDPAKKELLDWRKRLNIIEGVAQGLLYLHKYSRMRVIHRDLKASNVLLDENMNPKISDFGMARIFKQNETEVITNRVVGTYGYMSPEYAMEGTFSVKSDVFSFGVLILEIVSGRRNTSFYHLDRPLNLIGYAWELWKEGTAMELKDPTLGNSYAEHQLLRTIHVGLLCVQESATDRPTMSDVISILRNETVPLPTPKQPAFFTGRRVSESTSNANKSKAYSVNDLTMSVIEAR